PARQALVEFLVRQSLERGGSVPAPSAYVKEARAIARIAQRLMVTPSTVEDAAEGTTRIYAILARIPNEEVPPEEFEPVDISQVSEEQESDDQEAMDFFEQEARESEEGEGEEKGESYESPAEVDFRGEFKPEMVQLLAALREGAESGDGESQTVPLTQEMLEALLNQSPELQMDMSEEEVAQAAAGMANNLMREAGVTTPPPNATFGQGPLVHEDDDSGPLEATEPNTSVYDEWDFRADDYRSRWCMVRERPMAEGDISFWYQTLQQDAGLVAQIRRQFELAVPESMRKIRPLADGEDFDLDATIEFIMDIRSGSIPSDKIYWRRNKIERDVAVAFLLDMSASTAEAIDESRHTADDWDAPSDPVEYMLWLRTRRGEGARRTPKRIIDLEKESIVLIVQALEALGDQYGIYGFSGYGRENVEFYSIKDIREPLSDSVRRRVDKIAPLHATRMGPAIRHTTAKLVNVAAKTKILFLISDGRPQDRGYSREGVEKEYAVHDTHMALVEAQKQNITPFALTVDKSGHDYLKAMCGDMGYEILYEISTLPQRIPELYKRLTL
ncbi:MAG: VWA domain-containing protein, partial [Chloroflexi bacterium]|nr:VWA domain-containing protein [Chloroflexota bacterium]